MKRSFLSYLLIVVVLCAVVFLAACMLSQWGGMMSEKATMVLMGVLNMLTTIVCTAVLYHKIKK